jgi:branched-chain amino acid transport system permease protein
VSEFISFLVTGVVTGSIYAVTASGLVVTYNATGVFNFAHGAVGRFLA